MDYEAFFDELVAEYALHNVEIRYYLDKSKIKFGTNDPFAAQLNDGSEIIVLGEPKVKSHGWYSVDYDGLKNLKNNTHLKFFPNAADLVYCLAYELSERVGRLRDSLHNRMVLSSDRSHWRKRYVKRFGNVL